MTRLLTILLVTTALILGACKEDGAEPASESAAAPGDAAPSAGGEDAENRDAAAPSLPSDDELGTVEERIRRAEALIKEMIAAYKAAPAFTDTVIVEGSFGGMPANREESIIRMGRGANLELFTVSNHITVVDGIAFLSFKTAPDRFMKLALVDDLLSTLTTHFGSYGGVMIQPALRYEKPMPEIMFNMSLGIPGQPRISGYRIITDLEGRRLEQISMVSANGSGTINVDPKTKFIVSADVDYLDPGAPVANFRIQRSFRFSPQAHEKLSEPIEFDPEGRIAVRTRDELIGGAGESTLEAMTVRVGDMAPDFELPSMLGEKFSLREARGAPVVLVFWASWNVESLNNLMKLNSLAEWAAKMQNPARLVAIQSLWKKDDKAEEWQRVYDYWEREEMQLLSLIDTDKEIAKLYGVVGVPITVVIGPNGRIYAINAGIDDRTDITIRSQIIDAVKDSA